MGNIIFEPVALVITVAYPMYRTYKCLEHAEKYDARQWLTYWLVFGGLFCLDHLFGWILQWVPLYWTLKVLFLFVCAYFNGATILYSRYLKPYLAAKEDQIDQQLGKASTFVRSRLTGSLAGATKTFIEDNPDAALAGGEWAASAFTGEIPGGGSPGEHRAGP